MHLRVVAAASVMLILSGCSGTTGTGRWSHLDYQLAYNLPLQDRDVLSDPIPESEIADLTPRVYLVSDNQRHEVLGGRADFFRNSFIDRNIAEVSIRPPQLDAFGQDLLREMLTMTDGFVVHLGDACDISNTGEFGLFAWDMQLASRGWVMAPGNHDGYYFGNSSRTIEDLIEAWDNSSETYEYDGVEIASRSMQKDRYVSFYLAALVLQNQVWSASLAESLGPAVQSRYEDWLSRRSENEIAPFSEYWLELSRMEALIYAFADTLGDDAFFLFELDDGFAATDQPHLRRIAWQINKDKPWRSFILQEASLGAATAATEDDSADLSLLLVDSSQYGTQPSIDYGILSSLPHFLTLGYFDFQIAGETGGLHVTQYEAAEAITADMRREGRDWMIATHHPYDSLGRKAQERYDLLRDAGNIPASLSAHTHNGEIRWNEDPDREGQWLEINVGSVLDAPVEFRDFQIRRYRDRYLISSQRHMVEPMLRERGLLLEELPGYRPGPGDPDFYLDYSEGLWDFASDADFLVKRILLAAYLRMFRIIESDHPDQSETHWPVGPSGERLRSHEEIVGAITALLGRVRKSDVTALTAFLYELREFERTRGLTEETIETRRAYRLSQALWASQVELRTREAGKVTMDPDLSFFLLPAATSH